MYYSHKCTYCGRNFTVYEEDKYLASEQLYEIIKMHLKDYNEDHKEFKMDDGKATDSVEIFEAMTGSIDKPPGSYDK